MKVEWIVVANAEKARILQKHGTKPMRQIGLLENPLGRERNRNLSKDKPGLGRTRGSGASPFGLSKRSTPHEDSVAAFCRRIAAFLKWHLNADSFDTLTVAAEPQMLGQIRGLLQKSKTNLKPIQWVQKDLQNVPLTEMTGFLPNESAMPAPPPGG